VSDIVSQERRSAMMAAVRQKNTKPELFLRRALHKAGLRFRLHQRTLPGTPDIVLPCRGVAIFVNGCFWHRHKDCPKTTTPATRTDFWLEKFEKNVARDSRARRALRVLGWTVITVWECEISTMEAAVPLAKSISLKIKSRVPYKGMLSSGQRRGKNARRQSF
jgi:DNA mismatch endonuclease, patch repair protein